MEERVGEIRPGKRGLIMNKFYNYGKVDGKFYTKGNKDDINEAIHGLDIFTKNWCMDCKKTEKNGEPAFRCGECEFLEENENCAINRFALRHKHDYHMRNFGPMGSP